jgi:hypothetical protein
MPARGLKQTGSEIATPFSAEDETEVTGAIALMFVGAFSASANSKG